MTQTVKGIDNLALCGGDLSLDLLNTVHRYDREDTTDELVSYAALVEWSVRSGVLDTETGSSLRSRASSNAQGAEEALNSVRSFRRNLFGVVTAAVNGAAPEDALIRATEAVLREAASHAHLMRGNNQLEWKVTTDPADLLSMLWVVARAAENLLTSFDLKRVRLCGADDCTWMFVDRSKNGSRRWCQMDVCGNRAKAKRHYDRVRSGQQD